MSSTFNEQNTITYETLSCGVCGVYFALTSDMHRRMREDGEHHYCPNGHRITYCKTTTQTLRAQLEQKERELRASKCETLNEKMEREKVERKLKRVGRGVCPCCNRTFQNLARHMETKHAEKK